MGVVEVEPAEPGRAGFVDKGLKKDALGFVSSVVIGVGFLVLGAVLMVIWRLDNPQFFKRRPEVAARL